MALENSTATQAAQYSDVISYICEKDYSNEVVTIASGQDLEVGAVLGQILTSSETHAGNTGNGVLGSVTFGSKAMAGIYTLTCTVAATNAGTFKLTTPNGETVPQLLTVAVAYTSDHLNVTLADGSTDFIVGDNFLVTVATGNCEALDQTATDGTQNPLGILLANVDATGGAVKSAAVVRGEVIINTDGLKWNNTIATAQKNVAIAQMKRNGLVFRNGI